MKTILHEVDMECERAMGLYGPLKTTHEAYAVILEELDEFWDEVKGKQSATMHFELIQVAAMAIRTIYDLKL